MRRGAALSLCAQAVTWLAQRDHSELELRRKLLDRLQSDPSVDAAERTGGEAEARVEHVIAWLRERHYLDDGRFAANRVELRESRFGLARIRHEMSRHGVVLDDELAERLRVSEFERALALWQRRFGDSDPADRREAARQARFLAGRGFSGEVVRQVLRAAGRAESGD